MKKMIFGALFALGMAGCSSADKLPCQTTDWYELGRRHGARGAPENESKNLKFACKNEEEISDALALYENGRSLGLAEYCTEENGFEMGRTGQGYQSVCPSILEEAFMAGYKRGTRSARLQSINESLKKSDLPFARKGLLEGKKLQIQEDQKERDVAGSMRNGVL